MQAGTWALGLLLLVCLVLLADQGTAANADADAEPRTAAEESGYHATSRLTDVARFITALARRSPRVRLTSLGRSHEGRDLPLLIIADPPVATPAEAARSGKLLVFLFANIHAGEVSGKEALQLFARELISPAASPLLDRVVFLINPVFNADGNERIATTNRPWQGGPSQGVGIRANAQGLDLNRDFVKLASPEVQAWVRFIRDWNPHVVVDCHDTDGSYHRYLVTYDGPRHAAVDGRLITFTRERFLPEVSRTAEQADGVKTFIYGDFNRDYTRWETYPALPRYSIQYLALRGRLGVLSEAYTYAPFADRVRATLAFVRQVSATAAEQADEIRRVTQDAGAAVPGLELALRQEARPLPGRVDVLGWEEVEVDGRRRPTDQPKEYPVTVIAHCVPTLTTTLPRAYVVPTRCRRVIDNLKLHGIQMTAPLQRQEEVEFEETHIIRVNREGNPFQGVRLVRVEEITVRRAKRPITSDFVIIPVQQPLGRLAAYLLEAQAEDGLAAWDFFGEEIAPGLIYPVLRQP